MLNGVMFSQEFSYVYNPYPLILYLKDFFNKLVLAGNEERKKKEEIFADGKQKFFSTV